MTACATAVNIGEHLNQQLKSCGYPWTQVFDSTIFGVVMSGTEARLLVAWKDGDRFVITVVDSYLLQRPEHYQDFRSGRLLCDILDCWVKPITTLNQFGKVHSGALVLRGCMNAGKHSTIAPARFWTPKQGNGTRTAIYDIASGDLVGWFGHGFPRLQFFASVWVL